MTDRKGVFIALEGTDGSGKGTQFKLLVDKLRAEGHAVETFDFPQYEEPSSYFVKQYLNGTYGSAEEVGPYTSSLFYALDRFEATKKIKTALNNGKVVLTNRYTGSSMAHQGTKFSNAEERRGYFIWLDNLEFQTLGIPRPDRSFVLRVPATIAQKLVDQKASRSYTDKKRDIHEADINHLKKSVEVYDDMCQLFPKDFVRIDCVRSNKLLDIDTIHKHLYKIIEPLLPPADNKKSGQVSAQSAVNPYVEKTLTGYKITDDGQKYLSQAVTNVKSNVYAFSDKLSPVTIAAAMARLSRRADDMRITILDEFAMAAGKDEQLLQRVITAYGDDSVQQLVGQHIVVEGASNLLTKKLEWGRLAAYLEQSTRYIYFDQKNENGEYKYYTPPYLDAKTLHTYKEKMDRIFDLYSDMVHKLSKYVQDTSNVPKNEQDMAWKAATRAQACDAIRPVLPVSTKSTVGIYASGQALESLITHLISDDLPEADMVGRQMLTECRKVLSTFLERVDINERGVAAQGYRVFTRENVKELTKQYLSNDLSNDTESVRLADYWPKNELDLLPNMLYEHSNLSLKEISQQVKKWPIKQKKEVFEAYMGERFNRRHKPGRAIERAHYSWDLICDYGAFRDLQRHRIVDELEWQALTPRYGYNIPPLVEKAGLSDQFEECFDISLDLYSKLQAAGYELEAQYATLLGHKMRWKLTYNAREAFHLHEIRTSPQGHPGYRKLVQEMHEKLAQVHPLMASAMKFVNQGEDAELTRLAAEKYTQLKLQQLDRK